MRGKQKNIVAFRGGHLSYCTVTYKQIIQKTLNLKEIDAKVTKLQFSKCPLKCVLQCTYGIFRKTHHNLNNLNQISFFNVSGQSKYLVKVIRVLKFCNCLETLYIYIKRVTVQIITSLHELIIYKAIKQKTINLGLLQLRNFDERLGFLLRDIAMSCKDYFYTLTTRRLNTVYLKYFIMAADQLSRRSLECKPNIYLGKSISRDNYNIYLKRQAVLTKGNIKLNTIFPTKTLDELDELLWSLPEKEEK